MNYITFKDIGTAGNLASQIQQYASLYAIAQENNKTIVFPESSLNAGFGFKFAEVLDIDILTKPDEFFKDFIDYTAKDNVLVDSAVFSLDPNKNYNMTNRFDLYHYWYPKHKDTVMTWSWNKDYLTLAQDLYNKLPKNKETVAVHVRRGDYLLPQHDHFCTLGSDYYGKALEPYFESYEKYHFVIFSNDIEWCKANLIEEDDSITFVEPGLDYVDLIYMSLCDHIITANSSYSWWAAFKNTNENKEVTCPKNYLKVYSPWSHINNNYYPNTWKSINNYPL